ncbi:MAG TPA: hypothetical protein VK610_01510, partial [Rhodothermales bacterium]|nr:hypothetical protein [Rhodothermales bacterium]
MRRPLRPLLFLLTVLCGTAGVVVPAPTAAAQGVTWTDAPLEDALVAFAEASGVNLVFAHRIVEGHRVTGRWKPGDDPAATLAALLAGTGLRAERIRAQQFVVIVEPPNVAIEPDDPAAYTGSLEGRIVDAVTGEPLLGAHAFLVDLALGGVAKEDGSFIVPEIPTGEYTVRFSH